MTDLEAAQAAAITINDLINYLEIPNLEQLGVDKKRFLEVIPEMTEAAIASGSPANNPRIATKEEMAGIYQGLIS
jgi:alcohol dehydrogenase